MQQTHSCLSISRDYVNLLLVVSSKIAIKTERNKIHLHTYNKQHLVIPYSRRYRVSLNTKVADPGIDSHFLIMCRNDSCNVFCFIFSYTVVHNKFYIY